MILARVFKVLAATLVLVLGGCGAQVPQSMMPPDFPILWSLAPPEYTLAELEGLLDRSCVKAKLPMSVPEAAASEATVLGFEVTIAYPEPGDEESGIPGEEERANDPPPPPWAQQICGDFGRFVAEDTGRTVVSTRATDLYYLDESAFPQIRCDLSCPDQDCGSFVLGEADNQCWIPIYAD